MKGNNCHKYPVRLQNFVFGCEAVFGASFNKTVPEPLIQAGSSAYAQAAAYAEVVVSEKRQNVFEVNDFRALISEDWLLYLLQKYPPGPL